MCRLSRWYKSAGSARAGCIIWKTTTQERQHERMGKLGDLVRFPLDQQ